MYLGRPELGSKLDMKTENRIMQESHKLLEIHAEDNWSLHFTRLLLWGPIISLF